MKEPVGSVAEEAAKLFAVLQNAATQAPAAEAPAAEAAEAPAAEEHEHKLGPDCV
ncbi:MAG: hypothetical protein HOV67_34870, partial [Kribbellaceae bacterium]|nr:hypothetical protein [Kribbellaceae bacterium]